MLRNKEDNIKAVSLVCMLMTNNFLFYCHDNVCVLYLEM